MTALRESGPLTRDRISGDATDMTEQERDILLLSLRDGQGKLEDGQGKARLEDKLEARPSWLEASWLELGRASWRLGRASWRLGRASWRLQGRLEDGQALLEAGHNVLAHRMDQFEASITEVLRDGLAKVLAAVERFADTKADQSDVDQLRADVDELQRAAGE